MRPALLALSTMMVVGASSALGAQTVSLQVGASTFGEDHEPQVGVRVSPAENDVVGLDFSFDAYPRLLAFGALAGMTDLSLAVRIRPAAPVAVVGRAGGSALLGMSEGGTISFTGYHAGIGIIVTADPRTTVRLDYTVHRVPTFTFGFLVHH